MKDFDNADGICWHGHQISGRQIDNMEAGVSLLAGYGNGQRFSAAVNSFCRSLRYRPKPGIFATLKGLAFDEYYTAIGSGSSREEAAGYAARGVFERLCMLADSEKGGVA